MEYCKKEIKGSGNLTPQYPNTPIPCHADMSRRSSTKAEASGARRRVQYSNTQFLKLFLLICLLLQSTSLAAKKPELKFLKTTNLPHLGLTIKLMPDAAETPLSPPQVFTYTIKGSAGTRKEERFSARSLWYRSQHAGRWIDKHGNRLDIATITKSLPNDFGSKHVTKQAYEEKIKEANKNEEEWTSETMSQWVTDFTGATSASGIAIKKKPTRLKDLIQFSLKGSEQRRLLYAFRLNRSSATQARAASNWFLVSLEPNPNIPQRKAYEMLSKGFLASVTSSTTSRKPRVNLSSRFQRGKIQSDNGKSIEFQESRQIVVKSIQNMQDWWHVETENYVMLSNLNKRYGVIIKDLQRNVELMRSAYEQLIPARTEIKAVSVIRVFATSEKYKSYVGERLAWSGGVWMPSRKELVIRPLDWGNSKDKRDRMYSVTYHEAFHQYLHYALSEVQASRWFDEGHAEFFDHAEIRNGKIVVHENDRSIKLVREMIDSETLDIASMLQMDRKSFYCEDDEEINRNYALAWAIVYYLRKGAPLDPQSPHIDIPSRYIDILWKTKNSEEATAGAFADIDMNKFEADFITFWKTRNTRGAAKKKRIFTGFNASRKR